MRFFLQRNFRLPVARDPDPQIGNILEKIFFDNTR